MLSALPGSDGFSRQSGTGTNVQREAIQPAKAGAPGQSSWH